MFCNPLWWALAALVAALIGGIIGWLLRRNRVSQLQSELDGSNRKYLESNKQKDISDLLHTASPEIVWCDDILSKQWLKLAINCVINPLTALFDLTTIV